MRTTASSFAGIFHGAGGIHTAGGSMIALTFHDAVWLYPAAFVLHVLEEWPRFTPWARKYASESYTQQQYDAIHLAGIGVSIASAAVVYRFPNPPITFLFFTFVFAPSLL